MQKYFFNLGRNPSLSAAEILSVFRIKQITRKIEIFSEEILMAATDSFLDVEQINQVLGGSIKIGQVFDAVGMDEDESKFNRIFSSDNLVSHYLPSISGKIHFGVSIYNGGGQIQYVAQLEKQLKDINKLIKENLQNAGFKAGFVQIKGRFISSVSVAKNNLLHKGAEIVLIVALDKILVGRTMAVQEFEEFSKRDFDRPRKDKRSGIIPPKLARMMINISEIGPDEVIFDPFCGSGTVMQEAIFLGNKRIIGSDISNKAVRDTKENIEWIFHSFRNINRNKFNIRIFETDIRKAPEVIPPQSVDAVVTEPFLGPPLFRMPDENTVRTIFQNLEKLYLDAFASLSKIVKKSGKIVICFPSFAINGQMMFMDIIKKIESLGFRQLELISEIGIEGTSKGKTNRNTIVYGSRNQFVIREIIKFEKI